DSLGLIFNDKARSVLVMLPEMLKPSQKFNSKNELFFDKLNSGWRVAVASAQVGRGGTFNFVHFSEVAFYECALADMQAGIGEAIAAGAVQIYESTANGFNEAKELWDSESCVNVFYPWYFSAEYRSKEYEWLDKCDAWLTQRKRLLFEMGLDREQVTWYCKKYNSYIDKALIRQEYPITAEEAFVASGDCVFDRELLIERLVSLKSKPIGRLGYFEFTRRREVIYDEHGEPAGEETYIENIEFRESAEGYIRLHEEPIVRRDVDGDIVALAPYAIGADTSESGVDYFTAKVISVIGNRCVATLRKQKMDEEDFALQLYCLGRFYNDALIACEVNYSRHPIRVLRRHGYTNLFMRRKVDGIADAIERDFGFETTRKTKPIIISELVASFREDPEIECDIETLREMLTFVKKENGAQEAIVGKHDDLVMASAIGHFAAAGCEARFKTVGEEKPDFIKMNFNTADSDGNYIDW
ncbi:MAG: hypothetical protein IIX96_00045, partial [Clostridia bacterium]|nr:hypothetical protein [Clostridia bacterium]